VTADNILDARAHFPGPDVPVPVPVDPHDVIEMDRLRALEQDLCRPVLELLGELEHYRRIVALARKAAERSVEHKAKGYEHIKVGVNRELAEALGMRWG
jgi:hypothetical protein